MHNKANKLSSQFEQYLPIKKKPEITSHFTAGRAQ